MVPGLADHPIRSTPWPAFRFLWGRSFRNIIREGVARAKQPRYAVGLVAGVAYFAWFGWIILGPREAGSGSILPEGMAGALAPLLLAAFALGWWVSGRTHMALAFTPPEVQFFFQGPISRRTLLHFKLVRAQFSLLPLSIFFALAFGRLFPIPLVLTAASLWALLTTANLHQVASGLVRSSWSDQGGAGLKRQWIPMVVLGGGVAAMAWAFFPLMGALRLVESMPEFVWQFQLALGHPAAMVVLLPFHIALGPLLALDFGAWVGAFGGGLALLALHYNWVVRTDATFEEAAAEAGMELQAIASAFKEGRLGVLLASKDKRLPRPWFRLSPQGHPAVGLFWKNFTAFTRSTSVTQPLGLLASFMGFWVILLFLSDNAREASLGAMALPGMMAGFSLLMGPIFIRNDLRTDLQRLEFLRTLPLTGRDVVAGEVAASAASLTLVAGFFLVLAFGFFSLAEVQVPVWWWPWAAFALALFLLPFLSALATGIQNIIAVVFPAWIKLGPTQTQGVDQMGSMMIIMLITGVLLAVGLLGPVVFGVVAAFRFFSTMGFWALIPGLMGAWMILAGEVVLLVVLLGEAFDEMDPSEEGLLG